jgi:hypothetical protein
MTDEMQSLTLRHLEQPPRFFINGTRHGYERKGYNPFTFSGSISLTGTLKDKEKPYFFPLEIEVGARYSINAPWEKVEEDDKKVVIIKGDRRIIIPTPIPDLFHLYAPDSIELTKYSELYFAITKPHYPGGSYPDMERKEAVLNLRGRVFWENHPDPIPTIRKLVEKFIYKGERALDDVCEKIEEEVAQEKKKHDAAHKKCCSACKPSFDVDHAIRKFESEYIWRYLMHPVENEGCEFKTVSRVH